MLRFVVLFTAFVLPAASASRANTPSIRYVVRELEMTPASSVCPCFCGERINNLGQVVGNFFAPNDDRDARFWDQDVSVGVSMPSNDTGPAPRPGPFVFRDGEMSNLNDLLASGSSTWIITAVADVNDHGVIVGSARTLQNHHSRAVILTPVVILSGDADCNGTVDFFDIDPFLMAIFDRPAYDASFEACAPHNADANADGEIDFFDIDPFLAALFS